MRIEAVEVIPIRAPRKEAVRSAASGTGVRASDFAIVRIHCQGGYEGLGEISVTYPKIGFSLCHAARTLVAPAFVGENALHMPRLLAIIDGVLAGELSNCYVRAAFEMAL